MKKHDVILKYGPYLSGATVQHREDRLKGIVTSLTKDGHLVFLERIQDHNVVQLVVHGEVVYKCRIDDLVFGGDGKLDPKCSHAVQAVHKAY